MQQGPRTVTGETNPPDASSRRRSIPMRSGDGPRRSIGSRIISALGPFSLSLLLHGLVLTILSFVTWAVGASAAGLPGEFSAQLVQSPQQGAHGGFQFVGDADSDRPDSSESSEQIRDLASLLASDDSLQMSAVDLGNSGLRDVPVEALQRGDVVGAQLFGGSGESGGEGLGEGALAGGGPVGSLWGVGAGQRADTIVYVMDRSGSMTDTFGTLKKELKKAIGELSDDQKFNVIWFSDEKNPESWSSAPRSATLNNKRDAFVKIDEVYPEGQTDPVPAIHKALQSRPDVMFVLSDGDFNQQNKDVIDAIRKRNPNKRTIINTILFIYDIRVDGENVLETIARENRGTYKHVTEDDVRRRY